MRLPPGRRVDRDKVEGYLLRSAASRGKAAFFEAFGFSLNDWVRLHDALLAHAGTGIVVAAVDSPWGTRYKVRGPLAAADGRSPSVCTVWQQELGSDTVRLITAYPD